MNRLDPQQAIYTNARPQTVEDKAAQIRHLAKIGLAAQSSNFDLRNLGEAFQSLFEIIHQLADSIEDQAESMERAA